jgi:protein O-GlcNAc transferase
MDIFAMKPAPILVAMCGFATTTGSTWYDYLVVDRIVIPQRFRNFVSEKLVYMPWTYHPWCMPLALLYLTRRRS